MPPHLSHIGDDLSRGLLAFAESRPLGVSGLRWLKIHLANLYGYDKASFDERVEYVHEHLDDIYDSAVNPLEVSEFYSLVSITSILTFLLRDVDGGCPPTIHGNV